MEDDIVQLSFLHNDKKEGFIPFEIQTCEGDIILIINAILDYADILEAKAATMGSPFETESARYYVGRFRRVAEKYSKAIKYDRDKAIKKCEAKKNRRPRKGDDIGEDAMALLVKYSGGTKAPENQGSD